MRKQTLNTPAKRRRNKHSAMRSALKEAGNVAGGQPARAMHKRSKARKGR